MSHFGPRVFHPNNVLTSTPFRANAFEIITASAVVLATPRFSTLAAVRGSDHDCRAGRGAFQCLALPGGLTRALGFRGGRRVHCSDPGQVVGPFTRPGPKTPWVMRGCNVFADLCRDRRICPTQFPTRWCSQVLFGHREWAFSRLAGLWPLWLLLDLCASPPHPTPPHPTPHPTPPHPTPPHPTPPHPTPPHPTPPQPNPTQPQPHPTPPHPTPPHPTPPHPTPPHPTPPHPTPPHPTPPHPTPPHPTPPQQQVSVMNHHDVAGTATEAQQRWTEGGIRFIYLSAQLMMQPHIQPLDAI